MLSVFSANHAATKQSLIDIRKPAHELSSPTHRQRGATAAAMVRPPAGMPAKLLAL